MSTETAKDALARACRKAGVRGASELVGRLLDLSCGADAVEPATIVATLGLTPAEARVAIAAARGESVEATAASLGLAESTVKSYRKAIFAKTGASRDRDLRRLVAEASGLGRLAGASEIVLDHRVVGERLRVFARPDGRRVALIDYGPASGRVCVVMHGFMTGRRLPRAFVDILQGDGWRPVVIQRSGFGLSDPATGDYLATAADDMTATLDLLEVDRTAVLARDGGAAVAIAFADRRPDRVRRAVLLNPRSTRERLPGASGLFVGALSRVLLTQPAAIAAVCEFSRQRSGSRNVERLLNRLGSGLETDRLMAQRPEVATHLIRDTQGMLARTAQGLIDELRLYADGWSVPAVLPPVPWRVAWGRNIQSEVERDIWARAGAETRVIDGMGLLPAYTHPTDLAALLSG
jgi:pimeloyl-ACP methyl ester carboxylesterase/DNA-binding CsgD family transcriptional regulator